MHLVTDKKDDDPVVWNWLRKRTMLAWSTDLRCIGVMRDDGTITGAVGYNGWSEQGVWMHVAFESEHGLTRSLLHAAFHYPFIDCGRAAVYGLTPKRLEDAVSFNRKIGFREIGETVDCIIFEMTRDECRWLKGAKNGR
jgi:hypothetical protein